jgi:hypothetical protein
LKENPEVGFGFGRERGRFTDSPFRSFSNPVLTSLLVGLLFVPSTRSQAKIINAASLSIADVKAAIASAVEGDAVVIPAGTSAWTSGLTITKGITLIGGTTVNSRTGNVSDQTIILDNIPRGPAGAPIIKLETSSGKSYRVSGITFRPGSVTDTNYNGMIQLAGNSHSVRLDHCHFAATVNQEAFIEVWGAIYGVIDHNLMEFGHGFGISLNMSNWGGHSYGDGSWAEPAYYGSEKFVFIEDNYLRSTSAIEISATDDYRGARWVFRHNHCYNVQVGGHGTEGDRERGGRAREIYNNDFHFTNSQQAGGFRTGGLITHNNSWYGAPPARGFGLQNFRTFFAYQSGPWHGASGDNVWDANDTQGKNTSKEGGSPHLFESGTVSAGTTTTITDNTKSWTPNQWIGFTAKRVSANGIGYIRSNTSKMLTVLAYNDSGGPVHWAAGDQYQIHRVVISLDQPGRGAGDLLAGDPPINTVTGTAIWPHQALEPCYSWNDKYVPTNAPVNIRTGWGQSTLVEGRDFFNNTPMSGYTPYTYPHPLTTSLPPPQPIRSATANSQRHVNKRDERKAKKVKTWKWGRAKEDSANKTAEGLAPDQPSK